MLPVFHIKVDATAAGSSYHTSVARGMDAALAEFERLVSLWPDRFIAVLRLTGRGPRFITSNDESFNDRIHAKRFERQQVAA